MLDWNKCLPSSYICFEPYTSPDIQGWRTSLKFSVAWRSDLTEVMLEKSLLLLFATVCKTGLWVFVVDVEYDNEPPDTNTDRLLNTLFPNVLWARSLIADCRHLGKMIIRGETKDCYRWWIINLKHFIFFWEVSELLLTWKVWVVQWERMQWSSYKNGRNGDGS